MGENGWITTNPHEFATKIPSHKGGNGPQRAQREKIFKSLMTYLCVLCDLCGKIAGTGNGARGTGDERRIPMEFC